MAEVIERRVLGALRFRDRATGRALGRPMRVSASGASFIRNPSNHYVIKSAPGFAAHTEAFAAPPVEPPLGSLSLTIEIQDPLGQYLPRLARMALPRDPNPATADDAGSLFQAVAVNLYAASSAPVSPNWSTIRASLTRLDASGALAPLRGALLRVIRVADDVILGHGLSDERGEALVVIPGVPITQFADGGGDGGEEPVDASPVVVNELQARLEVSFDPALDWPVDSDALEASHATRISATRDLFLQTSRMERAAIAIPIT